MLPIKQGPIRNQRLRLCAALLLAAAVGLYVSLSSCASGSSTSIPSGGTSGGSGTPTGFAVLTYHNDNSRTGQNLQETVLTPANVNSSSFGRVGFLATQGLVDAEPLYVANLTVNGAAHNVVFVATEGDFVYAFDADNFSPLWQTSLLGAGETISDGRNCEDFPLGIGITSTPVIDPQAGPHGTIFVVAMSKNGSGKYFQRLHALDLATGEEQPGSPTTIQATYPSSSGSIRFDPGQYTERAALLLVNGIIYTSWASHCDLLPYTGWVMGYSEFTLQQLRVLNVTPNGKQGSIWMSGGGLAADSAGFLYFLDANGTFDTTLNSAGFPSRGDFGNAFVKLSTSNGRLKVADYFAMSNTLDESVVDTDLGSGGVLILPDLTDASGSIVHLAVGAGKDSNIYIVNRDSMGKFNPSNDNAIYQELDGAIGELDRANYSTPAYFNGTVYFCGVNDFLKAYPIRDARLPAFPPALSTTLYGFPGATPSISANGTASGIVWTVENSGGTGVLHAHDAGGLVELYNGNQAPGGRDLFDDNKFITPMIANGKVYVGTPEGVAVFGLLQ